MLDKIKLDHILFLDIETVPEFETYEELSEERQALWEEKTQYQRKDDFSAKDFYHKAGIWAEFGKIVCISVGFFTFKESERNFRTKSYHGNEKDVLTNFKKLLEEHFYKHHHLLCAHNGKEFDFPYIARRMIIHDISLPAKLNLFGKKPWEVPHLDTMELWRFGDYKHFTSLKLLTNILGIATPKDDISGNQVRDVFYVEKNLERIFSYCEKDVIAIAQIVLKYKQLPLLEENEIVSV